MVEVTWSMTLTYAAIMIMWFIGLMYNQAQIIDNIKEQEPSFLIAIGIHVTLLTISLIGFANNLFSLVLCLLYMYLK